MIKPQELLYFMARMAKETSIPHTQKKNAQRKFFYVRLDAMFEVWQTKKGISCR